MNQILTVTLKRILLFKLAALFFCGCQEMWVVQGGTSSTITGACWLPKFTEQVMTFTN